MTGILVLNTGSTSLKFAAYTCDQPADPPALRCRGKIDAIRTAPRFRAQAADGRTIGSRDWGEGHPLDPEGAAAFVAGWLRDDLDDFAVHAAGHRIVLGGTRFAEPVLVDDDVLAYLDGLAAVEPSHQPHNLAGVRAFTAAFGGIPQVAVFDSSFHRSMPAVAETYAIAAELRGHGIQHWGYHGISYDYISRQMKRSMPDARRVVAAHLGGGASLCAMLDSRSVDTTMGLSALSGLPMATRCGDLPPEVVLYLLRTRAYELEALADILYTRSGLLGLSGLSGDMRTLEEAGPGAAAAAIDHMAYHIVKYVGAYAAILGGLDAIVFTAGIGENSAALRARVCDRLTAPFGVILDAAANRRNDAVISTAESAVVVRVIPTDEEIVIAEHTIALVAPGP